MLEIERKFLISDEDFKDIISKKYNWEDMVIQQFYLWQGTEDEVRVRAEYTHGLPVYSLTKKIGTGLVREENVTHITAIEYRGMCNLIRSNVIIKGRRYIKFRNRLMSIDVFLQPFEMVLAEVEFESEEQAYKFKPPSWCKVEVTGDERFENRLIAVTKIAPLRLF